LVEDEVHSLEVGSGASEPSVAEGVGSAARCSTARK
jgi:hypothetical protein